MLNDSVGKRGAQSCVHQGVLSCWHATKLHVPQQSMLGAFMHYKVPLPFSQSLQLLRLISDIYMRMIYWWQASESWYSLEASLLCKATPYLTQSHSDVWCCAVSNMEVILLLIIAKAET